MYIIPSIIGKYTEVCQKSPEVTDALELMTECSSDWELIGGQLKVSRATISTLRGQDISPKLKLNRILDEWTMRLKTPVTWDFLTETLESDVLDLNAIAVRVKEKLCEPKLYDKYIIQPDFVNRRE